MADQESRRIDRRETGDLRHYVPQEILDVSFPFAVRGYDRAAVDAYVRRVNRVIAELKVSASPPHAVRHAVEEAEDKVQGLLRAGREAAEQITASARQDADDTMARAKGAAAELVVDANAEADRVNAESAQVIANARAEAKRSIAEAQADIDGRRARLEQELASRQSEAEARMSALEDDTEAVSGRRRELLDDISRLATVLQELAAEAGARFDESKPEEPAEEAADVDLADELANAVAARRDG